MEGGIESCDSCFLCVTVTRGEWIQR